MSNCITCNHHPWIKILELSFMEKNTGSIFFMGKNTGSFFHGKEYGICLSWERIRDLSFMEKNKNMGSIFHGKEYGIYLSWKRIRDLSFMENNAGSIFHGKECRIYLSWKRIRDLSFIKSYKYYIYALGSTDKGFKVIEKSLILMISPLFLKQ